MNVARQRTMGYYSAEVAAVSLVTVTAGGGADDAYQAGVAIDRRDFESLYLSAKALVYLKHALAEDETATVTVKVEDCDTAGGVYANAVESDAVVIEDTADADQVVAVNFNLAGFRQFIKVSVKVAMSAANTDTADVAAVLSLGGFDELPVA